MNKFVVVDLETTGHAPMNGDHIIEVGIVVIEGNKIIKEYETFLNPKKEVPSFITSLTGITSEDIKDAPLFKDKATEIASLFDHAYLIAHNVPFDLGFLNAELEIVGREPLKNPVIDTVELTRILFPQAPGYKLEQLGDYFHIHHGNPHRALSDAHVTAQLFLKLKEKLAVLPYETMTHLLSLEKSLHSDFAPLLIRNQQEREVVSDIDDHFISYRGLAFKDIKQPKKKEDINVSMFGDFLDRIYEPNGAMENKMKNFEPRKGQREMSEEVFHTFTEEKHALIEASTGTGKSIAYLLPAIYEAVQAKKRILISTHTTQLQTQLLEEEIPQIRKLIPFPFQIALLKGKNHYLSLERFARELENNQQDNYDITLTKAMLLVWITETNTGDIDEIRLPTSGEQFYHKISTDAEGVMDPSSPWFSLSYYQKARKKAQQADLVITNHALLCSDIFNDYKLLPSYEKVIIDEAHHMEDIASKHHGLTLDYVNMQYSLNQIALTVEKNWLNNFLLLEKLNEQYMTSHAWQQLLEQTKAETDDLFRTLFEYVIYQKQQHKTTSDVGRMQYSFNEEMEDSIKWEQIQDKAARLTINLRDLIHIFSMVNEYLEEQELPDKYEVEDLERMIYQLQSFIDRIEQLLLTPHTKEIVRWAEIEANGARNAVYLYCEPTDISAILRNDFFNQKKSVILTSATLTMRNSFSFIEKRLGIEESDVNVKQIPSPYSYQDQVQLLIPNDFPNINKEVEAFIYSTCEAIISLAEVTSGRMLVLFTSYDMLKKSFYLLKDLMNTNEYMLIAQGISSGSRMRLKKSFETFDRAILLGTSSFWEGVDIPGDHLSCLMIVRLPFQPPYHPIYEAKAINFKKEGKNSFFELSLPNAVIRFKQGFGRLIRSTNDRGIVFVCDARIKQARYGKYFTDSIPNVPITFDSTYNLIKKAEDWF